MGRCVLEYDEWGNRTCASGPCIMVLDNTGLKTDDFEISIPELILPLAVVEVLTDSCPTTLDSRICNVGATAPTVDIVGYNVGGGRTPERITGLKHEESCNEHFE